MENALYNLTADNLAGEQLCCIIRSRKPHPGVEAKRRWLAERLPEGHVLRKLDVRGPVFIEYAPLETAWVPVLGEGYLYLYCLWVGNPFRGRGYGRALLESCLADAQKEGRSGVCLLGARRQKGWLADQGFARKFGFETVDRAGEEYELLALSLDGSRPCFSPNARAMALEDPRLTLFYSPQCPFSTQAVENVRQACGDRIPFSLVPVESLAQAKALPCVFNSCALFYRGKFVTVNLPDPPLLRRLLAR